MKKYLLIAALLGFLLWAVSNHARKSPNSIATGNVDVLAEDGFDINGEHVD